MRDVDRGMVQPSQAQTSIERRSVVGKSPSMTLRHRRDVNIMYVTTANKSGGEAVLAAGVVRALEEKRMRDGFGERIVWGLGQRQTQVYRIISIFCRRNVAEPDESCANDARDGCSGLVSLKGNTVPSDPLAQGTLTIYAQSWPCR